MMIEKFYYIYSIYFSFVFDRFFLEIDELALI